MDQKVSRILCCEYAIRIAKKFCGFEDDTLYIPTDFYKYLFKLPAPQIWVLLDVCDAYDKMKKKERKYTAAFDKFHQIFDDVKTKN